MEILFFFSFLSILIVHSKEDIQTEIGSFCQKSHASLKLPANMYVIRRQIAFPLRQITVNVLHCNTFGKKKSSKSAVREVKKTKELENQGSSRKPTKSTTEHN